MKSPPRQTWSSADDLDRVLEVVDDAIERPPLVADRERMEHQAEDPASVCERPQLVVGQVAGVIVDGPTGGVRADHRSALDPRRGSRRTRAATRARGRGSRPSPTSRRRASRPSRESPPSSAAPSEKGFRRFQVSPAMRIAELPERLGGPELVAELLDTLEREHQPDLLAALDRSRSAAERTCSEPVGILAHGAQKAGRLTERLAQRALGLALELDEDGADLEADAARLEQRQPRAGERAASRRTGAPGSRARAGDRDARRRSRRESTRRR